VSGCCSSGGGGSGSSEDGISSHAQQAGSALFHMSQSNSYAVNYLSHLTMKRMRRIRCGEPEG